ncbi:MAG: hypothetical protein JRJ39_05805 [Deltaproteobacteria bacterium]|nr:hypothetical protein [Deltaproteobacteria bacterium]
MADQTIKSMTENMEAPVFDTVAFHSPPALSEATVAIVTTAALHHPDQEEFTPLDAGFRILDGNRRDYRLGHWSPNFDTEYRIDYSDSLLPASDKWPYVDSEQIGYKGLLMYIR